MSADVKCKVRLRRRGYRGYHYATTKHFPGVPQTGETIDVRDIDGQLVKAVVQRVVREQSGRSGIALRVLTLDADEVEA
jgi:hypothetical protein